jgi:DNA-binding transcriptional LysR family regulator
LSAESAIIPTDTSKILFLSVQYLQGIEMELRHLRYFVAAGEEQHFGRAALRLHLAQPALSRQIQDLEREIGFLLFDRLPRGVRLSAAGKLFLSDARRILQDVQEARRRAEWVALGKTGTLRLGIAPTISVHGIVVDSFREFRRRQPEVELTLHHLLSVHQVEAVLSDRLDAGFAASFTPWHKELAHWQFAEDRMMLGVPKGHPLTKRKRIRLRDLQSIPFIGFPRWLNPTLYDQMMQACARGGLSAPRIVQEATDRETRFGLVQCGIGVTWFTESTRWHCPRDVVLLPVFDMNVRLPFSLIWKKDNSSPLVQKFVAQVEGTRRPRQD